MQTVRVAIDVNPRDTRKQFWQQRAGDMQTVRVAIDVNPRDTPNLVCAQSADVKENPGYSSAISEALANALGVQEFLHRPERIDEIRRVLW